MPSDLDPKPSDSPPKESSHAPFGERIPERQVRRGAFPPARERSVLGHSLPPESDIFMISGISFPDRSQGSGAWGRIRTTDTRIFNPLLYQLSYPGALRRAGAGSIGERMQGVQRPRTISLSVLAVVLRQVIRRLARKHIGSAQPALQIHVRTPLRTERLIVRMLGILFANRTVRHHQPSRIS